MREAQQVKPSGAQLVTSANAFSTLAACVIGNVSFPPCSSGSGCSWIRTDVTMPNSPPPPRSAHIRSGSDASSTHRMVPSPPTMWAACRLREPIP